MVSYGKATGIKFTFTDVLILVVMEDGLVPIHLTGEVEIIVVS